MTKEQILEASIAKRIFPITGRIEKGLISDMEKALFQMCLEDPNKKANILIDSGGGDVGAALSGYDFIKSLPFEVDCTVVGDCHSATLIMMPACHIRRATKHSRFLFHAMRFSHESKSTENLREQMEIRLRQNEITFEQALTIQHEAYGISKKELLKMMSIGEKYDVRLTAEEALKKGVIHEIVEKFDFFNPGG